MSPQKPPHPDAARPPSPARGEGYAELGADALAATKGSPQGKIVSLGARSKWVSAPATGTGEPTPLAGEGGALAPGEGGASAPKSAKRARNARGETNPLRDNARRLRKDMTDAERKLWSLLRNRKLASCKFRRQVPVGPYVADFLSFESRLIVEADGGQHAAALPDAARDAWFRHQGYTIVRYWNSDILTNPEGVIASLLERTGADQEIAQ